MNQIWAVTAYFNPVGYRRRLENYRRFRQCLAAPLLTVEWSHEGVFELGPGDADVLIQIDGGDVMWQKERLLNLAVSRLPGECDFVAWLDGDVLFAREDWQAAAVAEAHRVGLCQIYSHVHHVAPDAETPYGGDIVVSFESLASAAARGLTPPVSSVTDSPGAAFKRGHAWCARRDLLAKHGLYDRGVIGSGDRMLAHAVTGQTEALIHHLHLGEAFAAHYRRWAAGFVADANSIGCVEGEIFHLWHGELARRRYSERFYLLREHDFDPTADISLAPSGCWRWSSNKPEMHRAVVEYFISRQEDGAAAAEFKR